MFHMNLICILTSERNQSQRLHTVSIHLWFPGKGKSRDEEQISGCQGLRLEGGFDNKGAAWGNRFEGKVNCSVSWLVLATKLQAFVKTHKIARIKSEFQCVHVFRCPSKGLQAKECAFERSLWLQCEVWFRHIKHWGHEISLGSWWINLVRYNYVLHSGSNGEDEGKQIALKDTMRWEMR